MTVDTRRPSAQGQRPWPSSFACKITMAVTGVVFVAFVFVHMVGNLKAYGGAEGFNAYAHWLYRAFTPLLPPRGLLWILRVVLAVSLVLHVACSLVLWIRGRRFRGSHRRRGHGGWWGARSMPVTGAVLLVFVVFHVLDLTIGIAGPAEFRPATDTASFAHENLVASMGRPWAGGFYLAAMLALGLHVAHGLWTVANDVGVTGRRVRKWWLLIGYLVALVVLLGNASLPVAVWLGVIA